MCQNWEQTSRFLVPDSAAPMAAKIRRCTSGTLDQKKGREQDDRLKNSISLDDASRDGAPALHRSANVRGTKDPLEKAFRASLCCSPTSFPMEGWSSDGCPVAGRVKRSRTHDYHKASHRSRKLIIAPKLQFENQETRDARPLVLGAHRATARRRREKAVRPGARTSVLASETHGVLKNTQRWDGRLRARPRVWHSIRPPLRLR